MSGDWSRVERCIDVRRGDVESAVATREGCASLLAHLAAISRPMNGAPLVLLLFARMATNACTWLEGGLCVNAIAKGETTVFDVLQDLGVGLRERLLPRTTMTAPLSEFDRAVRRIPSMIAPLTLERMEGQRFIFNLGHGIVPETPPEHVARLVELVRGG